MKNGIHPEGYAVTRKKTNADRIRSMTDGVKMILIFIR